MTIGASVLLGAALLVPAVRWWASGIPVSSGYFALAAGLTIAPVTAGLVGLRRMQTRNRAALMAAPTAVPLAPPSTPRRGRLPLGG
jgi:hypothetical protein